jgi:N-acetylglucosaminyl-diphospho-decaprenol L-rhamnosyltransferase
MRGPRCGRPPPSSAAASDPALNAIETAPIESTAVVIVSHDSGEWLGRCVDAVLAQGVPVEIVIVDNASRDGSVEKFADDARVKLVRNATNVGFSVACNQGAAATRAPRLLFLNPDCELPRGALRRLNELLDADASLAILGAQLVNSDGSPQPAARRRTPTPLIAIKRALGMRGDTLEIEAPVDDNAAVSTVDAVSGALMLMRRATFESLRGFDEGYVLHCEDLDLCRRALLAGQRIAIANEVRVVHHKGTSSRARPVWVEWQKHRGMLRYFRKFDAAASPWWLRLAVACGVWLRFPIAAIRAMRAAQR